MEASKVLAYGVRFLCIVVFINSTIIWNVTWKSALSGLGIICSFVLLKPSTTRQPTGQTGKKTEKTRDIIKELYPSMSGSDQEQAAAEAIYRLVSYDAENTESLRNFDVVKQNSNCVFARKAKLWGSPAWIRDSSIEDNMYRLLPMFLKFTVVCASQRLDGFLIELPWDLYGESIQVFADALRRVLTSLSDKDPSGYRCMNKSFIGKRGWVFEFNKVTFFITTFAPFYPETHPRYSFGSENCFVLFQPELSFAFHDLPPDTPDTDWESPRTVRDKIRVAFRTAGRPYHIPSSIFSPMALEILRPIRPEDPVIEWWRKS